MKTLIDILKASTITLTKRKIRVTGLASVLIVAAIVVLVLQDNL